MKLLLLILFLSMQSCVFDCYYGTVISVTIEREHLQERKWGLYRTNSEIVTIPERQIIIAKCTDSNKKFKVYRMMHHLYAPGDTVEVGTREHPVY